ncbi:hypothetical protein Bpfe_026237, partial [Biomphalaria pfeifferi]
EGIRVSHCQFDTFLALSDRTRYLWELGFECTPEREKERWGILSLRRLRKKKVSEENEREKE